VTWSNREEEKMNRTATDKSLCKIIETVLRQIGPSRNYRSVGFGTAADQRRRLHDYLAVPLRSAGGSHKGGDVYRGLYI